MSLNVIILAAGVDNDRCEYPVYLTELDGESIIERLFSRLLLLNDVETHVFAVNKQEISKFHVDDVVHQLAKNSKILSLTGQTKGSACTVLLGACELNDDSEVLIVSTNEYVNLDYQSMLSFFRENNFDAGTCVFKSIQPRYSYVRLNKQLLVEEVSQKRPISQHATAGIFWFKRASDMIQGIQDMIRKNATVDGKFYIAPVFNELILKHKKVGVYSIDNHDYLPLKNMDQVKKYEYGFLEI